jgi:hypothetical protein
MEADVWIDQRLLCSGDAVDDQGSLHGRTALDQTQGNRSELEVSGRTAHKTHRAAVELQVRLRRWQRIDAPVQVQAYQPAGRPSEVMDSGNRLLTPITAFVQVDGRAKQTDLVRDSAVVSVEADPRHARSDPTSLECPRASSRAFAHDVAEPVTHQEELAATERVRANSYEVVAG